MMRKWDVLSPQQAKQKCSAGTHLLQASCPPDPGVTGDEEPLHCILPWTKLAQHTSSGPAWCRAGLSPPTIPRDHPDGMGRRSSWLGGDLREGGAGRDTLCPAPSKSHCHNLVSSLLDMGWLPQFGCVTICESGSFTDLLPAHLWEQWSPAQTHRPASHALPDDISLAVT